MFNRTGSSSSISCEAPPHNTGVGSETSLCPTMEGSDTSTIQGYNGYIKPFSNSVKDGKYMEIVGPKFKNLSCSTGILQVYYRYVMICTDHPSLNPHVSSGLDGGIPSVELSWKSPSSWGGWGHPSILPWAMIANHDLTNPRMQP